jgi:predicted metal-dependent enzyme (double-stranded beta helix superfamily)
VFEIEQFVADCRRALQEGQPMLAVKEVVERTVADARPLLEALGEPERADLSVLHSADDLTVLHGIWAPQMRLYPHNHNMWAVIGIYGGREDNTFWRREHQGLAQRGGRELHEHEVVVLGADVIHSVANPLRAYTAAIHVYAGDYLAAERSEWDPQTLQERPFDFDHARQVFAEADEAWMREQSGEVASS